MSTETLMFLASETEAAEPTSSTRATTAPAARQPVVESCVRM
jgi:hypothetical protein